MSSIFFPENWTKDIFAQNRVHMNIQEMLRVIGTHTFEPIFAVMRVVIDYREGQKQIKKK